MENTFKMIVEKNNGTALGNLFTISISIKFPVTIAGAIIICSKNLRHTKLW